MYSLQFSLMILEKRKDLWAKTEDLEKPLLIFNGQVQSSIQDPLQPRFRLLRFCFMPTMLFFKVSTMDRGD